SCRALPPSPLVWARSGSDEPRGAHTHALRPRAPRSAVRAAPAACAAPCVLFGVVSFSKRPGSPGRSAAVATSSPRQHVAQAGDPQPQRGKHGPTGLVFSILAVIFLYSL